MQLNISLVREILLNCESHPFLTDSLSWNPLTLDALKSNLSNYSHADIAYTIVILEEAGYIDALITEADHGIFYIKIYRLTYTGHELLDTIRSPQIFTKIESLISSIGSASLPVILELGKTFLIETLTK